MKLTELLKTTTGRILFMSDLHYDHENVIRFDGRPFSSIYEMNRSILYELEKNVHTDDILIDLGDLFWKCSDNEIKEVLDRIHPWKFYKIIGNHDKWPVYQRLGKYFDLVCDQLDIKVEHEGKQYQLALSHYPMVSWNHKPRGAFMIHGHCHGNIDQFNNDSYDLRVDVGYGGSLAREVGSFLIPFDNIFQHFTKKAGTDDFKEYVQNKCNEL